jgi:hypothetical protein
MSDNTAQTHSGSRSSETGSQASLRLRQIETEIRRILRAPVPGKATCWQFA